MPGRILAMSLWNRKGPSYMESERRFLFTLLSLAIENKNSHRVLKIKITIPNEQDDQKLHFYRMFSRLARFFLFSNCAITVSYGV